MSFYQSASGAQWDSPTPYRSSSSGYSPYSSSAPRPIPSTSGDQSSRTYLPGYLSSTAVSQSSSPFSGNPYPRNSPPDDHGIGADSSPSAGRGGSPSNTFGRSASLFGNLSTVGSSGDYLGTPSRSLSQNYGLAGYGRGSLAKSRRKSMDVAALADEDAPPVLSLMDMEASGSGFSALDANKDLNQSPTKLVRFTPSTIVNPPPRGPFTSSQESPESCKVIVFGFPPSPDSDPVVSHFSSIGNVVSITPGGSNWIVITYADQSSKQRALRFDGQVLEGIGMIGVKDAQLYPSNEGIPVDPSSAAPIPISRPGGVGTPIPIHDSATAFKPKAGKGSTSPSKASAAMSIFNGKGEEPTKSNSAWSKVSDLIFGF